MNNCKDALTRIYKFWLSKNNPIGHLEAYLLYERSEFQDGLLPLSAIEDQYRWLLTETCDNYLRGAIGTTINSIISTSFEEADEKYIPAIIFFHDVLAAAMWKFHMDISADFEQFVREYDRLDVKTERIRLYEALKSKNVAIQR